MRTTLFSLFLLAQFVIAEKATAQKLNTFVGGNLILGFPTGDFKDGYKRATGIDVSLGFGGKHLYGLGTIGYFSYKEQSGNPYGKITVVPIKAGLRVYPKNSLFLSGNAGVGFLKDEAMSKRESRFMFDAGIGLHLLVGQISLNYDGWKRQNTDGFSGTIQLKLGLALK
ncbi:hypothetical protein WG954_09780 [Lacibacter sp. H375]|uniref:hypothetical protein n=1 Tax=Lacibacter sp. H375 TaxID=3133424 RepID=UPI0030C56685